jgi:hypothetical protein
LIRAIDKISCIDVYVESDPYVPLTVTWNTGSGKLPLYWRINGSTGGELEVKIDPESRALMELIVITEPPAGAGYPMPTKLPDREAGIPVFDCTPWGSIKNPDYTDFRTRIVTSNDKVNFSRRENIAYLTFPGQQAARILECGSSQVWLADDGSLTAVVAHLPH